MSCDVLLAVIGRNWSDARDGQGRLRLDDPNDYLRIEIETALRRRDVAVFPVLVAGARMPEEDELSGELSTLAAIQAHELADGRRWDGDVDFLADAMGRKLAAATAVPALLCALAAAALVLWPAYTAGLRVLASWQADPRSEEALLRLGVGHAAVWAIVAAAAAAGAAAAARGARAAVPAALLGALFGAVGGLLGGALDQALRAGSSACPLRDERAGRSPPGERGRPRPQRASCAHALACSSLRVWPANRPGRSASSPSATAS